MLPGFRTAIRNRYLSSSVTQLRATPNPLPATFIRGGTSKGVFISRQHLPHDRAEWAPILLSLMGSPDPDYGRQMNGLGGGVSSLSKVMVVGPPSSSTPNVDVEYTFVQVGIRDSVVDYTGNCGNLSSMVGPFALYAGLAAPSPLDTNGNSQTTIRALNTNTNKTVHCTFPLIPGNPDQPLLDLPQTSIAGVQGMASCITLDFIAPGGARTGQLLPSGHPSERITISSQVSTGYHGQESGVAISLVDATNPTVFVDSEDLAVRLSLGTSADINYTSSDTLSLLEYIRQEGARLMGLDPAAQAQPKIAVLSAPDTSEDFDIRAHALSMGVLHRAIPMTLGLCLGVAANIPGTVAWRIVRQKRNKRSQLVPGRDGLVRIGHPSGVVDVGSDLEYAADGSIHVRSAKVVRTGRRLMEGLVWW